VFQCTQKISDLPWLRAAGGQQGAQVSFTRFMPGSSAGASDATTPTCTLPGSVIQLSSFVRSPLAPTVLLQQWSSAPAAVHGQHLPVSTSAANGPSSQTASRTAAAAQHGSYGQHSYHGGAVQGVQPQEAAPAASRAMLLPWFAVVVELLGDVVQLVRLEADVTADPYGSEQQQQVLPQLYDADVQLDDLYAAELALAGLGEALQLQASQSTAMQSAAADTSSSGTSAAPRSSTLQQQQQQQMKGSSSNSNLAELDAASSAAQPAAGIAARQDIAAVMDAVCALLMYPSREIDTLFMRMVIDKTHVLSGEPSSSVCFAKAPQLL
jgi:hypothetical protein